MLVITAGWEDANTQSVTADTDHYYYNPDIFSSSYDCTLQQHSLDT